MKSRFDNFKRDKTGWDTAAISPGETPHCLVRNQDAMKPDGSVPCIFYNEDLLG
jgi:hypothetical protein